MKTKFLIIIGIVIIVVGYFLFLVISYPVVPSIVVNDDSECWVEIDDGVLTRCRMSEEFPPGYNPIPHPILQDVFCEKDCLENDTMLIDGKLGMNICNIMGESCAPFYPGMMNKNGSITIEQVISYQDRTEFYQFLIQDDKLRYTKEIQEK